jgi:glycosyltransferase involved in cell wall biosynthesis
MLPISVVMITFNHEKYIKEAIESVLNQSFPFFELIIVNDGSTDSTESIIKNFEDERIKYISQDNQGPSSALNHGQSLAQGKYIAFMSGDDVCHLDRLESQYNYVEKTGHKLVFTWVDIIDENSNIILSRQDHDSYPEIDWAYSIDRNFNRPTMSQAETIRHFFWTGNCFCAPTLMCETKILQETESWCNTSIQLQDFEMWIKLIKKYDFHVLCEKKLKYRILGNSQNLSHRKNSSRHNFELSAIMRHFFDNFPKELFADAFSDQLRNPFFASEIEYELEKTFLFLGHEIVWIRNIGLERLFDHLRKDLYLTVALEKYGFNLIDFFQTDFSGFSVFENYKECQNKVNLYEKSKFFRLFLLIRKIFSS